MELFVGLGNPGAAYARHRHNVGFLAVDAIAEAWRFPPWKRRFQGEAAEGAIAGTRVLLLKPHTFMNESGRAAGEAARFYKVGLEQVTVFHDELDLASGKLKVKVGGGAAGHNGLRSLDAHLGAAYRRVRIGIGHPGQRDRVTGHVLGAFATGDATWLAPLLDAIAAEAGWLVKHDDARFTTAVAQRLAPPRPKAGAGSAALDTEKED